MVRIRLRRTGLRNQPTFRLMVADKESPNDGRFLEIIGFYNPRTNPITLDVKEDRTYEWMGKGAQPTESVLKLFNSIGLMERFNRFKSGEPMEKLLEEAKAAPRKVIEKKVKPAKQSNPAKGSSEKKPEGSAPEDKNAEKVEEKLK
jgi:small subunit ribosomal protein S16